jgi:transposase
LCGERIVEYNERIEMVAQQSYPQVALLKQIKGVGTLIALTFLLTLEDPHRRDCRLRDSESTVGALHRTSTPVQTTAEPTTRLRCVVELPDDQSS